ncbi:MAG TPA: hypothetical protein ENJ38_11195 [Rhodospirillales bacterium]|nr:hypothetical protein [Rhodospirillales bacterium]
MTHLQISDTEPRIVYSVGSTPQSTFQIPFEFTAYEDIRVWVDGVEANYTPTPTTSTEFSVTGNPVDGGYDGGSIALGVAVTDASVVIVGDIPIERTTDFPYPSSVLNIRALNTELDRLTAIARQLESGLARTIRQPETDTTLNMQLPEASARAGKYLGFDDSGAPTAVADDPSAATPGFKFDGTDESDTLQELIDDDIAQGTTYRAIVSPPGGVLALGKTINIRNRDGGRPYVLDFSRCSKIVRLDYAVRIRMMGSFSEFPQENLYRLAQDASQNDTSITIDASPQNGDMSRFVVGARIIIRGEQDKHGEPLDGQRHEAIITGVSGATVTFANDPLPADFKTEYPNSAWTPEGGGPDRTLITVVDEWNLSADAAEGDRVLSVSSDPTGSLSAGDWVYVQDDRTAGDVQGSSSNRIRLEPHRVQAVSSTTVTLDVGVARDFQTAKKARITKLRPCWYPTIICPPENEFAQAPAASPASRIPAWEAKYCIEPTIVGPRLDDEATTYTTRGQLVRMEGCYRPRVVNAARIGKLDTSDATSGDRYGLYFVGCRDGEVEGGFFERCRHGIAFGSSNTNMLVRGVTTDDCLINGLDTHGGDNIGITFAACLSVAGPSRAPDAVNQSAGTVGNPTHQAGDREVRYLACTFRGFEDTDGAIDVHTPSQGVQILACVAENCADVVTLKGDGTIDGGEIAVDALTMRNCTGYAVDDDTTGTPKFARISIGTVLTDGSEAGIHAQGASGGAKFFVGGLKADSTTISPTTGNPPVSTPLVLDPEADQATTYDFDATLTGDLEVTLSTTGQRLGRQVAVHRSGANASFTFTVSGLRDSAQAVLAQNQTAIVVFDGTAWALAGVISDTGGGPSSAAEVVEEITASTTLTDAQQMYAISGAQWTHRTLLVKPATASDDITITIADNQKIGWFYILKDPSHTGSITIKVATSASKLNTVAGGQVTLANRAHAAALVHVYRQPGAAAEVRVSGDTTEDTVIDGLLQVGSVKGTPLSGVSGSLTASAHSGRVLVCSGNVTVPVTDGFQATIIASAAITVNAGSGAGTALAAGEAISVHVVGSTVYRTDPVALTQMPTA